jgi:plastocyanin
MRRWIAVLGLMTIVLSVSWVALPSSADTARFRAANTDSGPKWQPGRQEILKGDRIVWRNPTDGAHTVTAYSNNWNKNTTVDAGGRTAKSFKRRGTYKFRCMITGHSAISDGKCVGMCGKVIVR